ncbi:MAG: VWA domain-containing protein, partial [Novibacillus thermophilus]
TPALKAVRPPQMPSLAELGAEWGGGTRIGDALARVMRDVGFRISPVDTVAVVFSDGLDSGDPDRLRRAMRALKRRVHCVVWLNPLAAVPGYEPKARGMQAALPYIDVFAAADDATSFNQLAQRLRKGDSG